jgi:hypothetical protein
VPRPLLRPLTSETRLTSSPSTGSKTKALSGEALSARLRVKRSPAFMAALTKLDSGTHGINREAAQALVEAVCAEFPELTMDQLPLGIVAKCYLGEPFEVHTLDIAGGIVTHFKRGEPMPGGLEKARAVALNPYYAYVEVYPTSLRPVRPDGSVTVTGSPTAEGS